MAYEGSIPEHSIEWGTQISSFDFHTGFTGPVAALHLVGGGDSLAAAQWTRAGALLLTLLGVGFVVRALGGRRTGVVAAAFGLLALSTFAVKLSSLRPETLAYGPVLLGVGFAFLATVRRDRGLAAVAALTFAASVQIHGVGGTFGACLLLGVFCACLLPPERGATDALGQRVRSVLWVGGGITAATFAAGIIVTGMATPAGSLGDVPDLEADGYDPTYAFLELSTSGLDESEGIGYGAPDNEALFRSGLRSGWIEVEPDVSLAIAAGLIVAAVAAAFATPRARRLAVFTLAALGAVFLLSLYLSSGWETYVPRRTGFQRVLQLWFAVVVVVAVVLPSVLRRARVVTSVLVLGLMSALWAQSLNVVASYASGQPSARQIEAIEALPIERGATILTNAWTQGYVSVHTPGVGLLDGQAPYLDEPLLRRANGLLTSARAYFEDPTASPFDFGRFEVDYVLVATEAHAIGTPSIFSTAEAVSADPRLTKLTDSAGMVLLQVDDA
ncbi:MAG: hypothetical protein U5K30_12690 [Acidimicrobiales bacterium]|nr:hypothetical protein [Acidimicrobiales bacterium]